MPLNFRSLIFLCLSTLFIVNVSRAQQTQEQFGKNRVQYKNFKWEYISTYNFDIYYSQGGKNLATDAANYAELEYQRIIDLTSFTPYNKIKIIIYNSASEAQQSNMGLDLGNGLNGGTIVGGQTQFVKSKLEVAYTGSQDQFKRDLVFAISQMMINNMLFGGSLRDAVESSYLLSLPEWFVNGASAYIAEGWNVEMDNYMRSLIINKQIKKPSQLTGPDATLLGQSIWNYIAEKYGKENIPNILNLTRVVRNQERGIESGLGILYSTFIRDWNAYYVSMAAKLADSYIQIPKDDRLVKNRRNRYLRDLKGSDDGANISYVKNNSGRYKLILHRLSDNKSKTIVRGGRKLLKQQADPNSLCHDWYGGNKIVFVELKRGINNLTFLDDKFRQISKRPLKEFSQINSISVSKDGNKILMSADKDGQTDIYLYDINGHTYKQLTNDLFDDLTPLFVENTQQIVFSSNRISDTLGNGDFSYKRNNSEFSLFLLNPVSKSTVLTRLTDYGVNNAVKANSNEIFYLSDEKGIRNLYKYTLNTGDRKQVSNFILNADEAVISSSSLVTLSRYQGKPTIYGLPNFNFTPVSNLILTERQISYEQSNPRKRSTIDVDTTSLDETEINIQEYRFESDVKKQKSVTSQDNTTKSSLVGKKEEIKFKGPSSYQNLFGLERMNSTFMIDPLRGTGVLLEADMGDMLGNHRMNAGVFLLTDLRSNSVFGEYYYLKHRIDYKLRFDRKGVFAQSESSTQRYTLNKFVATASYPFSTSSRVSLSPFLAGTRYTELTQGLPFSVPDQTIFYGGLQGQFVYDNTTVSGVNMMEGTRAKVGFEQYLAGSNKQQNFGKFLIDLRHYQPVHRGIVLATRASYGEFFGNSKKDFLLGGMDNWLFNETNHPPGADPLILLPQQNNSDLLFIEYVTNMRGFNYNTQFGNKYLLFNAELRWPFVKYFYSGVINSNLLKNLQAVAFTDIGSSWSGKSPFSTNNSMNQTHIGAVGQAFSAEVVNFKNPFLLGYGLGLRTMILGYYIKGDFAVGVQDYNVIGKKFYLTFGHDF